METIIKECEIKDYPARTKENILNSSLTIAIANNFTAAGEKLTKKLCIFYKRHI